MAIYLGLNVASAQGNFLVAQMAQTLNKSSENIEDHWAVIERASYQMKLSATSQQNVTTSLPEKKSIVYDVIK